MLTSAVAAWPADRAFAEIAAAGVAGVEAVYRDPEAEPASQLTSVEQIRALAAAHGLAVCGLAAPVARAIGTADVVAALQAADELGLPWVRVFAPPFVAGASAASQLARLTETIAAALAEAGARARLLIELSQETLVASPELARRVLEPLGGRGGVVFDPANMLVEGNLEPAYAISLLGELLVHVHVKNSVIPLPGGGAFRSVPLARGLIDWPRVIRALDAAGYRGWLSIDRLSGATTRQRLRRDVGGLRDALRCLDR